ncbi:hypothetical protein PFISCL1PPCAC_8560, partial [Pristionchus fissidentatus]
LGKHAISMSEKTRNMHQTLVKALTIHALLPSMMCVVVAIYLVMVFDIYKHAALEKYVYTIAAIPPACAGFCTIYYVESYRRYIT